MENKVIGYYVLTRVPELDARFDDLAELATTAGVSLDYVPKPPKKRGAWELATNLGKAYKIDAPAHLVEEVRREYGVTPSVKLETIIVSRSAPNLIRHIVRRVTIPFDNGGDARSLAEKQLDQATVCIMEFDCESETMKSTGYTELRDFKGWVNGNLKEIVQRLHDDVDKALNRDNGAKVRDGLRAFLLDNGGTLQTAGGAYFLPYSLDMYNRLRAMKVYIEGCTDWAAARTETGEPADRASFVIIPFIQTDEALDTMLDIARDAEAQFSGSVEELINELSPLFRGDRTKKVADNIRIRVNERYARLQENVERYKIALNDSLPRLDALLDKARQLINSAMAVEVYRAPRIKETDAPIIEAQPAERGKRGTEDAPVIAPEKVKRAKRTL